MAINKDGDITGNQEEITKFTNWLLEKSAEYIKENQSTYIDTFMSIHNLHKRIISDIAYHWFIMDNIPLERTYRWADMTFRQAMRELKRH